MASLAVPGAVRAGPADSPNIEVSLLSEHSSVAPGRPFYVGLHMKIREGWHTYWKNPGDAGLPLKVEWDLPPGFEAGPIEWPAPERFTESSLMTYGYSRDVVFPVEIRPPNTIRAKTVTIAGKFDWLECKEVCLPGSAALRVTLPVSSGPPTPGAGASALSAARSRVPARPDGWSLSAIAGPRAIELSFRPPAEAGAVRGAHFFADEPLVVEYAMLQGFEPRDSGYRLTVPPSANAPSLPRRLSGVLVVENGSNPRSRTAVQVDVPVTSGDPSPAPPPAKRGGLSAAAYAGVFGVTGLGLALLARRLLRKKSKPTTP